MADAYVRMLEMVAAFMVIVDETYPVIGSGRGNPPAPPESDAVKALMARVGAFGSLEAYAELRTWWDKRLEFEIAVSRLDEAVARSGLAVGGDLNLSGTPQYEEMSKARDEARTAVDALQARINQELRGS